MMMLFEEGDSYYRNGYEAGLTYPELNGGLEDGGMPDPVNPYNSEIEANNWERGFFAGYEQACEQGECDRWAFAAFT